MVSNGSKVVMLAVSLLAISSLRAGDRSIPGGPAMGSAAARRMAPGSTICVAPFRNMSGRAIGMTGIEDQLAAQLNGIGYRAGKPGELGSCDAVVHTEIVHLAGNARMRVEVEFRLVLAGEQAPRLSATAGGKSSKPARRRPFVGSFVPARPDSSTAEREAILSALAEQSRKIQAAQRDGMALYVGAGSQPE